MAAQSAYPPAAPPHQIRQPQLLSQPQPQPQPQQQQQQQQPQYQPAVQKQKPLPQTRKNRSFSFRSDKSHDSNGNGSKTTAHVKSANLHETSAEKEAKRIHSKADPTLAMNEAEPSAVAATGKSVLAPLRNIQHRDAFGNLIADPDRSNPTRSRWERPLDTIRSFEAAIDGGYSNRKSIYRSDADSIAWGNNNNNNHAVAGARFSHDSYYGGRPPSMMYSNRLEGGSQPDLRQMGNGHRDNYPDHQQLGYNNSYPPVPQNPGRRGFPRTTSELQFTQAQRLPNPNEYAIPNNHRSYETVASASGSGTSGEPAGYQTDPTSSENSSIDRMQASVPRRPHEPVNDYGIGFGSAAEYQPPAFTVGVKSPLGNSSATNNYQDPRAPDFQNAPPVPMKERGAILRKATTAEQRPVAPEKRKSWFSRRFSKHG
ncbi:hypothetical protein B0T22DRAFT_477786 [Podospora appendiculata]|uniref:DUF2406 domain-containing protein n=1 Tax=Podospora appendiculata TaxID=314037 RepID=A0AAE0XKG2_9PEZI|nr:hypothetical protein B0T22DRAFT_477786 [Podospora appendiculata]